jgi:hypothetical protein
VILVIEIVLLIVGLIALIGGKAYLSKDVVVRGTPARLLGLLAITPIPLQFILGFCVGFWIAVARPAVTLQQLRPMFIGLEIVATLVCAILYVTLGSRIGKAQAQRERELALEQDDDYDDHDVADHRTGERYRDLEAFPTIDGPPRKARTRSSEDSNRPIDVRKPARSWVGTIVGVVVLMGVIAGVGTIMYLAVPPVRVAQKPPEPPIERPIERPIEPPPPKFDQMDEFKIRQGGPVMRKLPVPIEALQFPDPIKVTLVDGGFETEAKHFPGDAHGFRQKFVWEAKAETIYCVQLKANGAEAKGRTRVLLEGPGLQRNTQNFRFPSAIVFAAKAGLHTASVFVDEPDKDGCAFSIREVARDEALPLNLRIQGTSFHSSPISSIGKAANAERICTSAFLADSRRYWINETSSGELRLVEMTVVKKSKKLVRRATYVGIDPVASLGVDGEGRVYAQTFRSWTKVLTIPSKDKRPVGDILVWDKLDPGTDKEPGAAKKKGADKQPVPLPLPEPRVLPLAGFVSRFVPARDGSWLYFLDVENRKLGRIDPKTGTIDRQIGPLSTGVCQFCLTPDGKTLYCCSTENTIDVIDAGEFRLAKSLKISEGAPIDVAATDGGLIYLLGKEDVGTMPLGLDISATPAGASRPIPVARLQPMAGKGIGVLMTPNQQEAICWGSSFLTQYDLVRQPGIFETTFRPLWTSTAAGGDCALSPDGRLFVHISGNVFWFGNDR